MQSVTRLWGIAALALLAIGGTPHTVLAAEAVAVNPATGPTYADLADLADSAEVVLRAQISKVSRVENERARGLRTGWGRFYVQARTKVLLTGRSSQGEDVNYLVDLPLDARGKPPTIKRREVLIFGRAVNGRPGELQLVAPDAQVLWSAETEARLRAILGELVASDAPAAVTGVRELIYVPGTLAGEGETQIFLATKGGSAASVTVQRKPGASPVWGASFSELVGALGNPPRRETLAWYRLACFLPATPPAGANLSETETGRAQADADYRLVLEQLGDCPRSRR